MTFDSFLQGLSVAVFGGWIVGLLAQSTLLGSARKRCAIEQWPIDDASLQSITRQPGLASAMERISLALLVGLGVPSVGAILGVWIAVRSWLGMPSGAIGSDTGSTDSSASRLIAVHGAVLVLVSVTVAALAGGVMSGRFDGEGVTVLASILPLMAVAFWLIGATITETAAAAAESMPATE